MTTEAVEKAKAEAYKIIVDEIKAKLAEGYWGNTPDTEADDTVAFRQNSLEARIAAVLQQKENQNKNLQENFDEAVKINKEYQATIMRCQCSCGGMKGVSNVQRKTETTDS